MRMVRKRRAEVDALDGDPAPQDKNLTAHRDDVLIGEIESATQAEAEERKRGYAAATIQSMARMWIQRTRFVRHLSILKGDISVLTMAKQTRCAILIQRCMRGLVERIRYRKIAAAEEAAIAAEAAKKSKKGKGKSKAAPEEAKVTAPLTYGERALQRNMSFVSGYKALCAGKWDEAIHGFEAQLKVKSSDSVTTRMLESARKAKDAMLMAQKSGSSGAKSGKESKAKEKGAKKK